MARKEIGSPDNESSAQAGLRPFANRHRTLSGETDKVIGSEPQSLQDTVDAFPDNEIAGIPAIQAWI
jgi:hypothetical protein